MANIGTPVTITTNGTTIFSVGNRHNSDGMKRALTIYLNGDFGGGTLVLMASPDNGTTWVAVPNATANSNALFNVDISATSFSLIMSGATAPSVNVWFL